MRAFETEDESFKSDITLFRYVRPVVDHLTQDNSLSMVINTWFTKLEFQFFQVWSGSWGEGCRRYPYDTQSELCRGLIPIIRSPSPPNEKICLRPVYIRKQKVTTLSLVDLAGLTEFSRQIEQRGS